MSSIIKKDLKWLFKASTKQILLIFLIIIAQALFFGKKLLPAYAMPIIVLILMVTIIGSDLETEFEKFLFSTPISKFEYAGSKFILTWIFAVFGVIFGIMIFLMNKFYALLEISHIIAAMFVLPILMLSILIPLFYKFGIQKARIIMFGTYILLFGSLSFISNMGNNDIFTEILIKYGQIKISLFLIIITMLISLVSLFITTKILKSKEY
ncbi:MAG: ABC-2 transporter permease [Tissierellia bacterium]|nr:ABC-2 transporter permease [Tissierellia bacterium]